jgi:hypothetical protein
MEYRVYMEYRHDDEPETDNDELSVLSAFLDVVRDNRNILEIL